MLVSIADWAAQPGQPIHIPRIFFYASVGLVVAAVSYGASHLIWRLSMRYRLYPKIRERDVHIRPTPRLGGVAMFLAVLVGFGVAALIPAFDLIFASPLQIWALLGAAGAIVLIGVADDVWDLDWLTKLAGQILAAGLLAWQIQLVSLPVLDGVAVVSPFMSLTLTVLVIVLVMNAINFIDGLDGLVAGVAIIANSVFFIYTFIIQRQGTIDYFNLSSFLSVVIVGACLGFLVMNWHPAKLFMGDAGSMLVGLLMAASAVGLTGRIDPASFVTDRSSLLPAFIPIVLPFAVLIMPLLDFTLAVFRRVRAGKSPFSADRMHLHHRLLDMGHSHLHAVFIFYAWTLVVAVGCLLFLFLDQTTAATLLIAGLLACGILTLAPLTSRRRARVAADTAAAPIPSSAPQDADHSQGAP